MKDNSLDNWYRGSFEQTPGNPPDLVWDNIAANLDQTAATGLWSKIVVGAAIVLLLGGATTFFLIADQTTSDWPPVAELPSNYARELQSPQAEVVAENNATTTVFAEASVQIQNAQPTPEQTNTAVATSSSTTSTATASPAARTEAANNQQQTHAISTTTNTNDIVASSNSNSQAEEPAVAATESENTIVEFEPVAMQMQNAPQSLWDQEVYELPPRHFEPKRKSFKLPDFLNNANPLGYYLGTGITLNSVYALNYDTYSGLDKSSLVSNVAQFGSDVSLIGGLNVSDTKGYQVELTLFKSRGQSFDSYVEGQLIRSRVDLAYSQVNFLWKRKIAKTAFSNKYASSLNFLGGPYVAYLRSSSVSQNGIDAGTPNRFINYDAGLDFGIEYDLFFSKKWAATAGIRSSVGLVNIFAGTTKIPRDFNRTYNLSLGANIGLKYLIGK